MSRKAAYDYIHMLRQLYIPRTPGAALQAAEEEVLPIEAFIYKSTALNPLLKKPYNLDEIEWLLSRRDRDLHTNLILKKVLDELARNEDKEIALFAAESLNAQDKDYNSRLTELKERIEEKGLGEDRLKAAGIYFQMALLNSGEKTISHFYMKEAYLLLKDIKGDNKKKTALLFQVLIHLRLFKQAEEILPEDGEFRLQRMEIAYRNNDLSTLKQILRELKEEKELNAEEKKIIEFWTAKHE